MPDWQLRRGQPKAEATGEFVAGSCDGRPPRALRNAIPAHLLEDFIEDSRKP